MCREPRNLHQGHGQPSAARARTSRGYLLDVGAVSPGHEFEDGGRFLRAIELAQHGLQLPFPAAEIDPRLTVAETVGLPQFSNHFSVGEE